MELIQLEVGTKFRTYESTYTQGVRPGCTFSNMEYLINTDPDWLGLNVIHAFLLERTGWAQGIPREVVARSITNSPARPSLADPDRGMVRRDPDLYKREA